MNQPQTERVLAQKVVFEGRTHSLALVEISRGPCGRRTVSVTPFAGETHSTVFYNGTVEIVTDSPDGSPRLIYR